MRRVCCKRETQMTDETVKKGAKADDRVWEGAHGLEWTVPSPAPWHTFTTPPKARIANEAFE